MEYDERYWCCDCHSNYIKKVERDYCNDCCARNNGKSAPLKSVVADLKNLHGWSLEE